MKLGVHTSISGGIDQAVVRAAKLGCDTFQIFSTNPRGWKPRKVNTEEVAKVNKTLKEYNIGPIVVHTPYLINLASPKVDIYQKSIKALTAGVERADKLGAKYLVLHPGSHTGSGRDSGLERIATALEKVLEQTNPQITILLENVAGAGTALGVSIEELEQIISYVNNADKLGICYDTCHGFAAGYDIRDNKELDNLLSKIDNSFGLDKLGVIHLNDSKTELGSNKDRHEHIGQGKIGLKGFENLVNHSLLQDKLFILETPVDKAGGYSDNLATSKDLIK